jgi:hypothetical protein
MRHRLAVCAVVASALAALVVPASGQVQRSFDGETVKLELSAGAYWITPSYEGRIRVLPRSKTDQVSVRVNVSTFGRRADVTVRGPEHGFEADIEVPRRVNLVVTLAAGALRLRGIEGSKDISAKSGEIEIEMGDRHQYGHVMALVRTGAVNLPGFQNNPPGQRSFEWTGNGAHDLRVRLNAGSITLRD